MIFLAGGSGSIGRRYKAVLHALGEEVLVYDAPTYPDEETMEKINAKCSASIVATPTSTHSVYAALLETTTHLPYLIEKPLTKSLQEARELSEICTRGFVVNNWAFLNRNTNLAQTPKTIDYNFYNTGRDGLLWDVCQLIYIAELTSAELTVRTDSYTWDVRWDEEQVPYAYIEQSYFQMVRALLEQDWTSLWSIRRGVKMTESVNALEIRAEGNVNEGFDWCPSENEFHAIARKGL